MTEEAPHDSVTRKKARYELKALERVREDEANVAARDEAQMQEMSRNVQEAADLHEQQQQSRRQLWRNWMQ